MRRLLLSVVTASAFSGPVYAEDTTPGWYVGAAASLVFMDKYDITIPPSATPSATVSSNKGGRVGANVGYHLSPYIRAEAEAFFETFKDKRTQGISGPVNGSRAQNNGAVMGNIYVDFANGSRLTPYVGGGFGELYIRTPYIFNATGKKLTDWTTAYQLMAGTSYLLAGPAQGSGSSELYFGYRFIRAVDDAQTQSGSGISAKYPYQSHSADLGFRYNF